MNADVSLSPFAVTRPAVMGIINVTPDSFHAPSRVTPATVAAHALVMASDGADILDIGACSTRPGSVPVSEEEELSRLIPVLEAVRTTLPFMPLSIDTFRRSVALECVKRFGTLLINDVSGSDAALPDMPYVLTCPNAFPKAFFAEGLKRLAAEGVKDVILDPGFGFGKSLDDNYRIMAHLDELTSFGRPVLVGVSRKSMIYKPLGITPENSLEGTVALQTFALMKGATILRVHDVRAAVQTIQLMDLIDAQSSLQKSLC